MSEELVLIEKKSIKEGLDVEVWTLNRPKVLNALHPDIMVKLSTELDRLNAELNENIMTARALILKGSGGKAFAAGADISVMHDYDAAQAEKYSRHTQETYAKFEALPIPTIAAVDGYALGGGCELAMSCDMILANANAKFGQPECFLGLLPGFGGTARFVQRMGLSKGMEYMFSGKTFGVEQAESWGLVQRVVAADKDIEEYALDYAKDLTAKGGPLAIKAIKEVSRHASKKWVEETCDLEARTFAKIFTTADAKEGIRAFVDKEKANFSGE